MRTSPLFLALASSAALLMPLAAHAADSSATVSRAEFVQILVEKFYQQEDLNACFINLSGSKFKLLFRDVQKDAPYARSVCVGMLNGFVRGYSDGTFQPDKPVNLAEAGKIVARVFGTTHVPTAPAGQAWYRPYVESLVLRHAIPVSVKTFDQFLTRDEVIDMLTRLESGNTSKQSPRYGDLDRASLARWKQQ